MLRLIIGTIVLTVATVKVDEYFYDRRQKARNALLEAEEAAWQEFVAAHV